MKYIQWRWVPVAVVMVMALSACDKSDEQATGTSPGTPAGSETGFIFPECEQYFTKMQACVNSQVSQQEQQQLNQSLQQLQSMMAQADNQDQLKEQCQQGLNSLDEQMKALGCSL